MRSSPRRRVRSFNYIDVTVMSIASNLAAVHQEIIAACARVQREPGEITLVAASKGHPIDAMREYLAAAKTLGIPPVFGESYVQEAKSKVAALSSEAEFHLMGPLQSNKVRDAVALFDVIQSVHTTKVLSLISKEAVKSGKVQRVLLQINISRDPNKSGFAPEEVGSVLDEALSLPGVAVEGIMAITAIYDDSESVRSDFRALRSIAGTVHGRVNEIVRGTYVAAAVVSMGMSGDYGIAIEEGSSMVRIGTAIFGERDYPAR